VSCGGKVQQPSGGAIGGPPIVRRQEPWLCSSRKAGLDAAPAEGSASQTDRSTHGKRAPHLGHNSVILGASAHFGEGEGRAQHKGITLGGSGDH
jgi:hypothetical protein